MANDVEYLLFCLMPISVSSYEKCLFKSFLNHILFIFLNEQLTRILYVVWIYFLGQIPVVSLYYTNMSFRFLNGVRFSHIFRHDSSYCALPKICLPTLELQRRSLLFYPEVSFMLSPLSVLHPLFFVYRVN